MLTDSARGGAPADARLRVQAPNSTARAIRVIALDEVSTAVVRRLAEGGWKHATFLMAAPDGPPQGESHRRSHDASDGAEERSGVQAGGALTNLAGDARSVAEEVDAADLVVLVAGPGGHAHAAASIGRACSLRRVMTTAFVVGVTSASQQGLSRTLAQLRPWSLMMVIANSDDYIEDTMRALRA